MAYLALAGILLASWLLIVGLTALVSGRHDRRIAELAAGTYRQARRAVVLVVGGTVLLVGLAMLVLPGPAIVMIPLGLGILAIEFAWARRWLRKLKQAVVRTGAAPEAVAHGGADGETAEPLGHGSARHEHR